MSERAPWYSYLPLLVFPLLIFSPIILSGKALFWGTPITQFIPWWTRAWDSILEGVIPLWNDLLGMGAPLIANYQSAIFYPPNWSYLIAYMLGGVAPMTWLQAVMVVLHLAWASFGMALLIQQLKLGRLAQVIGGLSFGLSGYLVARAGFLSINASVAWMPWIVLGVTKLVQVNVYLAGDRTAKNGKGSHRVNTLLPVSLLLAGCLALQLLAGHAQTTWYTILLALIWFVYFSISRPWSVKAANLETGEEKLKKGLNREPKKNYFPFLDRTRNVFARPVPREILIFAALLLIAVMLAAVQLLPTAEFLLQSQRSAAVDYEFAMNYSFWPWRFLSFLTPDLFGNPAVGDYWGFANYWEDAIYIGLIPFVLAIAALLTRGRGVSDNTVVNPKFIYFLLTLILISFIIALGRNTPIFPWLYRYVPTFDMFQAPTRFSIVAVFSLSILAAIGTDSWHRPRDRYLYWLRLGIMAAAAVTLGAGLALLLSGFLTMGIRPSFIRAAALLGVWGIGLGVLTLKAPQDISYHPQNWGWWQWAVIIWVGLDLVVAGWGLNPGVDLDVFTEKSPTTSEILSKLNGGRLYLPAEDEEMFKFDSFFRFDTFHPFIEEAEWQDLRAIQLPNVTILDGIPSANNFDPLQPGRYTLWMDNLADGNTDTKERMLNLMGISVVETIDSNQQFGVRFNQRNTFPRIRWSSCGKEVASGERALQAIADVNIDLENMVILENSAQYCSAAGSAELKLITSDADRIILKSISADPGYLVIADVWYPGWRAYVDGKSVPLLRANYLFKAIPIANGEHEIIVVYQPILFFLGAGLSGLSLFVLIIFGLVWLGKHRLKERTFSSIQKV